MSRAVAKPSAAEIEVEEWAAPDAVAAAGQDLVRIALMTHVPDQLVVGRVEDRMDSDGQFHDTEGGTQVAAGFGDSGDDLGADLAGKDGEIGIGKPLQVGGTSDAVEKRCDRATHGETSRFVLRKKRREGVGPSDASSL